MKKTLRIRQLDSYDCGAASLLSVARWWGIKVPLSKIRRECGCTPDGISISGIIEGAASIGLEAKGFKSDKSTIERKIENLKELKHIESPVIAHITQEDNFLHYVVIYKVRGEKIVYMDPSRGEEVHEDIGFFAQKWNGYIITFSPSSDFKGGISQERENSWIKGIVTNHKRELYLALAASLVISALGFCNSLILQIVIDDIIPSGNLTVLIGFSSLLMLLLPVSLFIGYARNLFLIRGELKIDSQLILGFLKKIFSLPLSFFGEYSTGDLESRIAETSKIRSFAAEGLIRIIVSGATFVMVVILMFVFYSNLAIYTICLIPVYITIYIFADKTIKKMNRGLLKAHAAFESDIVDTIEGAESIKHHFTQRHSILYAPSFSKLIEKRYLYSKRALFFGLLNNGVGQLLLASIIIASSIAILKGFMTIGEMVAFYTLSSYFIVPMNELIEFNTIKNEAFAASERIDDIMQIESEEDKKGLEVNGDLCNIKIENLCYRYKGREPLLNNINCTFKKGSVSVITGKNGCGKSTLVKLLLRDLSPTSGEIICGGNNVECYSLESWRKFVGIVPQTRHLFNTTILNNITSFHAESDLERVARICVRVGIDETISKFPSGIMTNVGSKGVAVSGGEVSKIAIARMLYQNPTLCIFDESTSFIDKAGEERILNLMKSLRDEGKIVIAISHTNSIKEIADQIIQL